VLNISAGVGERPKVTVIVYVVKALVMERVIMRTSGVVTDTKMIKGLIEDRVCRIPSYGNCNLPPILLVHRDKRDCISAH
jgi:hypothetical protein